VVGYVSMIAAGVAMTQGIDWGAITLAVSSGLLLVAGIRNAWDITVWIVTRNPN
jgi:hypothetical protein